ncbi:MAG: YqeG family HAD IIIA-type phosphatase [Candidatus Margulisiibacteriota bacterium]
MLHPKDRADSIYRIDFDSLKKKSIKYLIFDIDDTLIPRKTHQISPELDKLFKLLKKDFKIFLLSNSIRPKRIKKVADALGIEGRALAGKPMPFAYAYALKKLGGTPKESAMIGDQLFMDIWGGNLAGMHTIMVKNILPETFWLRKWMRWAENKVLGPKPACRTGRS